MENQELELKKGEKLSLPKAQGDELIVQDWDGVTLVVSKFLNQNVNNHTEQKNGLTYLSWAWAWAEVLKIDQTATYEIECFADEKGLMRCYMHDDKLGYMVFTKVTIKGLTREMWLPVMDYKNKAMIDNATMFDINKTIMRCLTKNLAMFGLGLYIYAGEDLPTDEPKQMITEAQKKEIVDLGVNVTNVKNHYHIDTLDSLTYGEAQFVIDSKKKAMGAK